jgi:hypothetical protein
MTPYSFAVADRTYCIFGRSGNSEDGGLRSRAPEPENNSLARGSKPN